MSNSKLICYTKLSPNCTKPRTHAIDTISIHCMAGNLSVETCLGMSSFQTYDPVNGASCNYAIGSDGRIGLGVDEVNRSWCTSSRDNDHRAVTIEVANDGGAETGWHVSDKALAALIDLLVDICQRNGIKALLWKGDKSLVGQVGKQNMTVHRWFAAKACPGDYLYNLHGEIAAKVNSRLSGGASGGGGVVTPPSTEKPVTGNGGAVSPPYTVRVKIPDLRIRKGAGTNYTSTGFIKPGVYTIVAESTGQGAKKWGKLKSGAGWIALDYTVKM